MSGTQSKRALRQQIPIKSLNMTHVENDAVPLGDRPVIDRFFANYTKYIVGSRACIK